MLRHLHVRNLALIDEATLDFGSGLTVLTGETGAGKSILLDALTLLTGVRGSPSVVRSGKDRATVEAIFDCPENRRVEDWLAERGVEPDEPGEVLLRREVQASGRSRAWINGRLVPLSQMADLAGLLLVLHGQHEQQSLLEAGVQRDLFDEFAGLGEKRDEVTLAYRGFVETQADLDALQGEARDREQRIDFLRFQVEELEGLGLKPGEIEELEAEAQCLGHVEELAEKGAASRVLLCEGTPDQPSAADLLGSAFSLVGAMAEHDSRLQSLVESLGEAVARLDDAGRELSSYVESLEGNPERLGDVQERIDTIRRALRKHGPTEEEALDRMRELKKELDTLENLETACAEAKERVLEKRTGLARSAADLSAARTRAKKGFLRPFIALLKDFGMTDARADVLFRPLTRGVELSGQDPGLLCGPEGREEVELLFSANKGEALNPLRKVASGGELSRIMLALRSLSARRGDVPLLVFDEIDAGISGTAVRRVAERLAALGGRHQVVYVTHQPALASVADTHWQVDKEVKSGRTRTLVRRVEGRERQEEIARLLGDGTASRTSLALAAEMLQIA